MLNPNHKNPTCYFAAEIVSYLYGEIGVGEKQKFEAHLKNCVPCADELAEFSDVRFAFSEIKNEFSAMKTPVITIPYEKPETIEVTSVKNLWFDEIRAFLANFSAWQTGAAFAVLIILAVFSILLLKGENDVQIATNTSKSSPNPTVKKSEMNSVSSPEKPSKAVPDNEINDGNSQPDSDQNEDKQTKPKSVVKVGERPQPKIKPNNNKDTNQNNNNLKNNNRNKQNDLPRLNEEDDSEDDSLRLADLFEEIDTTED